MISNDRLRVAAEVRPVPWGGRWWQADFAAAAITPGEEGLRLCVVEPLEQLAVEAPAWPDPGAWLEAVYCWPGLPALPTDLAAPAALLADLAAAGLEALAEELLEELDLRELRSCPACGRAVAAPGGRFHCGACGAYGHWWEPEP